LKPTVAGNASAVNKPFQLYARDLVIILVALLEKLENRRNFSKAMFNVATRAPSEMRSTLR
jgi:hypothetical protein